MPDKCTHKDCTQVKGKEFFCCTCCKPSMAIFALGASMAVPKTHTHMAGDTTEKINDFAVGIMGLLGDI